MDTTQHILPHVRLMLNVKYPTLEECWSEGYESAQLDEEELSNPYTQESIEHEHWAQGWWAAYYGEEHMYAAKTEHNEALTHGAANESQWTQKDIKRWAGRVVKIAGAIAVSVAVVELIDMAV